MSVKPVPAYSLYGVPVTSSRPAGTTPTSRPAPPSAPYVGRGSKCKGNEDTCNANRVSGEEFCAGHLRAIKGPKKEKVVTDGE